MDFGLIQLHVVLNQSLDFFWLRLPGQLQNDGTKKKALVWLVTIMYSSLDPPRNPKALQTRRHTYPLEESSSDSWKTLNQHIQEDLLLIRSPCKTTTDREQRGEVSSQQFLAKTPYFIPRETPSLSFSICQKQ